MIFEMLQKQNQLDKAIENTRARTLDDIKLSMIAEVIEFNEETKTTHKTWKYNQVNESKLREEFIDILFFFLQLILRLDYSDHEIWELNHLLKGTEPLNVDIDSKDCIALINLITNIKDFRTLHTAFSFYILLGKKCGIISYDYKTLYRIKWKKNVERIGKEWN